MHPCDDVVDDRDKASQSKGTDPMTTKCNKEDRSVREDHGSSPALTTSKDIEDSFAAVASSLGRIPQAEEEHILAGLVEERRKEAETNRHCRTDSGVVDGCTETAEPPAGCMRQGVARRNHWIQGEVTTVCK